MSNMVNPINVSIVAVVLGLVFLWLGNKSKSMLLKLVGALLLIFGAFVVVSKYVFKKDWFEGFDDVSGSGCTQNINIVQNCAKPRPSPGPGPTPQPQLSKQDVVNWIKSVNPSLTSQCEDCVVDTVMKLWKMSDLMMVKAKSLADQKNILDALVAFDCQKQCVVTPAGLDEKQVRMWVGSVYLGLSANCYDCIVKAIMKMWSPAEFAQVQTKSKHDQTLVVRGLLAFDCANCDVIKISPTDVRNWLSTVLTGANAQCYQCLVDSAVKNWTPGDFSKVKAMNKKSQQQVVQALLALNCVKECVQVPSGLQAQEVHMWLNGLLAGANANCYNCLVNNIIKVWTQSVFNQVKMKTKDDQVKIIQGMIAFACYEDCMPPAPLSPADVSAWVKQMLSQASVKCLSCVVSHIIKLWDSKVFADVKSKSPKEQMELAQGIVALNCAEDCGSSDCPGCKTTVPAYEYDAGSPLGVV